MRKRVFLLIAFLCGGIAVAMLLHPTSEPQYNGRPLSHWITTLGAVRSMGPGSNPHSVAEVIGLENFKTPEAYRQFDTNAVPYLVEWIQYEPAQWRDRLADYVRRLPPQALFTPLADHIDSQKRELLAGGALVAFDIMGAKATPAIPDLVRLMNDQKRPMTASRATYALGSIGTNSVAALFAVMQNPKHPCQSDARTALLRINQNLQPRDILLTPVR